MTKDIDVNRRINLKVKHVITFLHWMLATRIDYQKWSELDKILATGLIEIDDALREISDEQLKSAMEMLNDNEN